MLKLTRLLCLLALATSLCACSWMRPYQSPVQQGVQLQQSQIDQLKPGMTPSQVEYILGTPNIKDPYQPNNWYYVYTMQQNYQPMQEQKFEVIFNNGQLTKAISTDFNIPRNLK